MFGQFPGQQQTHGGLDLSRCDAGALVVVSETRRFTGDALEDVVDERVHDAHRLGGDPGVRMNLLQLGTGRSTPSVDTHLEFSTH